MPSLHTEDFLNISEAMIVLLQAEDAEDFSNISEAISESDDEEDEEEEKKDEVTKKN